jgi:hypothetical protein
MRQLTRSKSNPTQRRADSWSPRSSPSGSPQLPPSRSVTAVVEVPRAPHGRSVLAEAGLDVAPLFAKPSSTPDTTPTSVLEVLDRVQAAGWGTEARMGADDAELERERIDHDLELEFEAGEQANRVLFVNGLRAMPSASSRGVAPNAPFMPVT